MKTHHAFENLFRSPWELWVSLASFGVGALCLKNPMLMGFSSSWIGAPFIGLGLLRGYQGLKVKAFHARLLTQKPFSLSTQEVPISQQYLYVGRGFRWLPLHRQRLSFLSNPENQSFTKKNVLYRFVQAKAKEFPESFFERLTKLSFLKPPLNVGGKPWIHGVGSDEERPIFLNQANRNAHECVFGMTRVGKTRLLSIKVNQDIRNGQAVLVIDPKGDSELLADMYCAAKAANRLADMKVIHFGFPTLSATYNPLASFSNIGEVASRVSGAISASGEGRQFKDFAWQYLNIVATCLFELNEPINYKTIAFYIKRPELLLISYVDRVFPSLEPKYLSAVQDILDDHDGRVDKAGNPLPPMKRSVAIKQYLGDYLEHQAMNLSTKTLMEGIVVPLFNAATLDKTYYDKITASVGPVLDKINQTKANEIFSFEAGNLRPEVRLEEVIQKNQIVFVGLDSLTNKEMAESVGQAMIADLVSLCGRLYNQGRSESVLNLYCDEFSNIVRDEFINLLNKAGGAGIRVTALTQTVNDLGAAMGGCSDKAKMLLGNFGTMTMLRVSNQDTAETFTRCLESIRTRFSTPSTMSNDKAGSENGELFSTYNTDTIAETNLPLVEVNDVFSLPKGEAFILCNGGEVYKIRIPLPKNDGSAPESIEALMGEVNRCV
jgi:conjugative coupling factor TraD (TOL family)